MAVDTKVETLIINRLSRNKYEQLKSSGALKDDELYITPMITKISELENDNKDIYEFLIKKYKDLKKELGRALKQLWLKNILLVGMM